MLRGYDQFMNVVLDHTQGCCRASHRPCRHCLCRRLQSLVRRRALVCAQNLTGATSVQMTDTLMRLCDPELRCTVRQVTQTCLMRRKRAREQNGKERNRDGGCARKQHLNGRMRRQSVWLISGAHCCLSVFAYSFVPDALLSCLASLRTWRGSPRPPRPDPIAGRVCSSPRSVGEWGWRDPLHNKALWAWREFSSRC